MTMLANVLVFNLSVSLYSPREKPFPADKHLILDFIGTFSLNKDLLAYLPSILD